MGGVRSVDRARGDPNTGGPEGKNLAKNERVGYSRIKARQISDIIRAPRLATGGHSTSSYEISVFAIRASAQATLLLQLWSGKVKIDKPHAVQQ